jgi:catechol 2,3-dioxygenase-like lactoylglutathione lyase family enzyme
MLPRVHVITLAVADLERALGFYRDGLGFPSKGIVGDQWNDERTGANGAIAPFELAGGLLLGLYPRTELAKDAEIADGPAQTGELSLGQLVGSRAEVDELLARAAAAGAVVTPAHDRPWGIYSGYFRDLDGHLWEAIFHERRAAESAAESRHLAVRIDCPPGQAYTYACDPARLPEWAPGLGSSVEQVGGEWFVETGMGRVRIEFAPPNDLGVLDHDVTLPSGEVFHNPMRVLPDGDGCEVVFTLRRQQGTTDTEFERDAAAVAADLERLKRLLESSD